MIENRDLWLENVLRVEGGYSYNKDDPGLATNFGITQKTLSDWRGEECGPEDVAQLTEEESRDIYLAKYWQVMRGDQLPGGIDAYACDFAVNSGPARAAKILQSLVDTKADSFIGPLTLEAIRKKQPLQLLLDYHAARMDFLMDLPHWDKFGRGWTNRCNKMLAVARSRIQARPAFAEAASSKIIKTNAPTAAIGLGSIGYALQQFGPQILAWLQAKADDPATLERLQSGVSYIGQSSTAMHLILVLLVALTASVGANVASVWWRNRMWRRGEV